MAERGLNKVMIIGRLGKDPECNIANNNSRVANVVVATSEHWKDKSTGEKQEKTEWHRLVFFNRLAEVVEEYLQKGMLIYAEGKLQTRKWTDHEGVDRYSTEVVCYSLQMLGTKGEKDDQRAAPVSDAGMDDDIPF